MSQWFWSSTYFERGGKLTSYDIFAFKSKRQSCPWLDAYCSEKTRQRMQRVLLHRKALLMHNFRRRRGSKHIANLFTNMLKRWNHHYFVVLRLLLMHFSKTWCCITLIVAGTGTFTWTFSVLDKIVKVKILLQTWSNLT